MEHLPDHPEIASALRTGYPSWLLCSDAYDDDEYGFDDEEGDDGDAEQDN